jgi:hypothetical protein
MKTFYHSHEKIIKALEEKEPDALEVAEEALEKREEKAQNASRVTFIQLQ